jgi:hypothetical protein
MIVGPARHPFISGGQLPRQHCLSEIVKYVYVSIRSLSLSKSLSFFCLSVSIVMMLKKKESVKRSDITCQMNLT